MCQETIAAKDKIIITMSNKLEAGDSRQGSNPQANEGALNSAVMVSEGITAFSHDHRIFTISCLNLLNNCN